MSCIEINTLKNLLNTIPEIKANPKVFNAWKEFWNNKLSNLNDDSIIINYYQSKLFN